MAAPATAERTRAAAGAIPATLNETAPDEKVEGVEEAAVEVPEVEPGVTDETGVVAVTEGVETVAGEVVVPVPVVAGVELVDAAVAEVVVTAPMEKSPL